MHPRRPAAEWLDDGHQAALAFDADNIRARVTCPHGTDTDVSRLTPDALPTCRRDHRGHATPECIVYAEAFEYDNELLWDLDGRDFQITEAPLHVVWRADGDGVWLRPAALAREAGPGGAP